jgi:hypothetical protein
MSYRHPVVKPKGHHNVLFREKCGVMDNSGWPWRIHDKAAVNYDMVEYVFKVHKKNNIETPKMVNYQAVSRSSR